MSDLIKRGDIIKKIIELNTQVYEGGTCIGTRTCLTKEEVIYAIDEIPSVESERKKGRLKTTGFFACQCSECGAQFYKLEYTNFCPNCGAKWEVNDG